MKKPYGLQGYYPNGMCIIPKVNQLEWDGIFLLFLMKIFAESTKYVSLKKAIQ